MDAERFDSFVRTLRTRRSAIGLAASFGIILGAGGDDAAAKKCKKKCGPCKRCKKGKCKPKPGSPRCGPCSVCQGGKCVTQCSPDECAEGGEGEICLKECPTACDTCSRCDRILGQCERICEDDECEDGFCRVPCETPCGECSVCDFGVCDPLCDSEQCVNGRCEIPCTSACFDDEECMGGECFPVCDPLCAADKGCVAASGENACVDLAGNCADEDHVCLQTADSCVVNGRAGRCFSLPNGAPYCAKSVSCSVCATDVDCQSQGFGPNSRCVSDCEFCFGNGGFGCVRFAADLD